MAGQGGQPWAAAHLLLTQVSQPGCFTTQGHVGASSSWLRSVEKQEADLVVKATRPTGWGPSYLGPDRSLPACREPRPACPSGFRPQSPESPAVTTRLLNAQCPQKMTEPGYYTLQFKSAFEVPHEKAEDHTSGCWGFSQNELPTTTPSHGGKGTLPPGPPPLGQTTTASFRFTACSLGETGSLAAACAF